VGNLVYVRDQQIITQKGVVIGRFNASVREVEEKIMRQVFVNLGVNIIGNVPNNCLLEGGDFMILKPELAVLGIGMRTNFEAACYLMENDLIGCERLALIIDENDLSQERMHLDTYFNILTEKTVVLLDFEAMGLRNEKPLHRRVVVYEKDQKIILYKRRKSNGNVSSGEESPEKNNGKMYYGLYKLIEKYDKFSDFLEMKDYKICYVDLEQQRDYITNFLNIGNHNVISVCKGLEGVLKKNDITDVKIDYLEFDGVKKLYGAIHCASQVSRGCIFKVDHL